MSLVRRLPVTVLAVVLGATGVAARPAAAEITPVRYGTPAPIATGSGRAEYVISTPDVVVFHKDEYDAKSPTSYRAGAVLDSLVRVRVSVKGLSGEVSAASVDLVYEAPDGLLAATTYPPYAFEKTDELSAKPSTLTAGQRITGEVYFDAEVAGGKVIASATDRRQAVWRP